MTPRAALLLLLCACGTPAGTFPAPNEVSLTGRVITAAGHAIAAATVSAAGQTTQADGAGTFTLDVPEGPQVVRAAAPGYHARAVAAEGSVDIVLYPDNTLELIVTGDMVIGPRFADPNGDGDPTDALLVAGDPTPFGARFAAVGALTADAEVVVPFLDTAIDEGGPPHPTRPVLVVAPPAAVGVLPALGADVVSLATGHVYDRLDPGVSATLAAVRAANAEPLGAGADALAAYRTVVVERRGIRLGLCAFSGATGRGEELPVPTPPFADALAGKAGVARLGAAAIDAAVAELRARADRVVVLIHGGREHADAPTNDVINGARRAIDAGADLVIASHPRVLQGIESYQGKLIFYSLGALVADDNAADGQASALLRAFLPRAGPITDLVIEPLFLDGFLPYPAAGRTASAVLALAGERAAAFGVTVLPDGRVVPGEALGTDSPASVSAAVTADGAFADLPLTPGRYLVGATVALPDATLWLGREVLRGGDMEDTLADGMFGRPAGWDFPSTAERIVRPEGGEGLALEICRSGTTRTTAAATSAGRFAVARGRSYTLCGCWRGDEGTTGAARILYYDSLDPSAGLTGDAVAIAGAPPPERECFCRTTAPPPEVLFLAVRLEHTPTADNSACVQFDDMALTEWEPQAGVSATAVAPNRWQRVRVTGVGGVASVSIDTTIRAIDATARPAARAVSAIPTARREMTPRRRPGGTAGPVTYTVDGEGRALSERVGCVVAADPTDPLGDAPYFTLAASGGGALQLVVRNFTGPGAYPLPSAGEGTVVVVEEEDLSACAAERDRHCFQPTTGACEVTIDAFDVADGGGPPGVPAAVRWGTARGSFTCDRLRNPESLRTIDVAGTFTCDASDWSALR